MYKITESLYMYMCICYTTLSRYALPLLSTRRPLAMLLKPYSISGLWKLGAARFKDIMNLS